MTKLTAILLALAALLDIQQMCCLAEQGDVSDPIAHIRHPLYILIEDSDLQNGSPVFNYIIEDDESDEDEGISDSDKNISQKKLFGEKRGFGGKRVFGEK
ncbi:hypothetical protein AVEN_105195-1 [Araneus ventricosus]|uniref:Uncharacterized protein n=1 Tax=Araneus ventricosus TaxID=182803 RepID=A0A4Y2EVN5_ARAVE|nr:hypothetical protein AVEN_105195-1 [Araneus ventricosus]